MEGSGNVVHWSELEMIRALLVDDQPQILEGLEMLLALESDVTIVGTAQTAEEAIALAHELQPDIIVMDVRLPGSTASRRLAHLDRTCRAARSSSSASIAIPRLAAKRLRPERKHSSLSTT